MVELYHVTNNAKPLLEFASYGGILIDGYSMVERLILDKDANDDSFCTKYIDNDVTINPI